MEAIKLGKRQKEIVAPKEIVQIREKLFEMKLFGRNIEELYEMQLKLSQADIGATDRIEFKAKEPLLL